MSIFTIKNNRLEIETENLTIPEFREIYERDTSIDKETALLELSYIYHMVDYKSPYNNLDESTKILKLAQDYFKGNIFVEDELIKKAIEKYKELQETPSMRLLKDAKKALTKIRLYYQEVNLNEKDSKGNNVNKITDLTSSLSNLGKIVESIDKLEEKIKKEQVKETKIRGQKDISDYERL